MDDVHKGLGLAVLALGLAALPALATGQPLEQRIVTFEALPGTRFTILNPLQYERLEGREACMEGAGFATCFRRENRRWRVPVAVADSSGEYVETINIRGSNRLYFTCRGRFHQNQFLGLGEKYRTLRRQRINCVDPEPDTLAGMKV